MNKILLTLEDFANIYDVHHGGRKARTLSIDTIFQWIQMSPYVEYNDEKDEFYRKELQQ